MEYTKRNEYSYFTALKCNAQKKREKDESETRQKFFCIEVSSVEKSEFSSVYWTLYWTFYWTLYWTLCKSHQYIV